MRILESTHVLSVGKELRATQSCVECLRWVHKICSGIKGELKSNVDFCCRRCLEEGPVGTVLQREVEIEPNVKLECVPKLC